MLSLAAEPASILYLLSGAIGFLFIRRRKPTPPTGTLMLLAAPSARVRLQQLHLTRRQPTR
jgi:hypothetical protein